MMSQTHIGYVGWQQPDSQTMPEVKRLQAAEAFWKECDGVEQQVEAMTLIARHLKARPKFVQGLPLEKKARYLVTFYPEGVAREGWHDLKVTVKTRGEVTTRPGYFVPSTN